MTGEQDVKLYMYDLSKGLAKVLSPMLGSWWSKTIEEDFEGVWHSGIVVFGQEYYFNGDLVHVRPGETAWGEPTKVVSIGYTPCSRKALHQFVVGELRPLFNRSSYDALNNNCNHFADRLTMYLCNRHMPAHILQQPKKLAELPGLQLLRPLLDHCLGGGSPGPADCEFGVEDDPPVGSASGERISRSSKELPGTLMFPTSDDSPHLGGPSCRRAMSRGLSRDIAITDESATQRSSRATRRSSPSRTQASVRAS